MSAQATSAPASASTSQNCLPRPLPAPVTSATLPSRLNRSIGLPTGPSPPPDRTYLPEYSPPRNCGRGRFPALATTTTTVIYRTARTTSQPGAGDTAWLPTGLASRLQTVRQLYLACINCPHGRSRPGDNQA